MTAGPKKSSCGGDYEGFKILPVKFAAESRCPHHLFFKPHSVKAAEPSKPPERTLFCANVPPWMTAEALRRLFQNNGPIEAVYLQLEPSVGPPPLPSDSVFSSTRDPYRVGSGFRYAYIVFSLPAGVRNTMTKMALDTVRVASTPEHPIAAGLTKWAAEYNERVVDAKQLTDSIQGFMQRFDQEEVKKKEEEEDLMEADEEGWITVTKSTKKSAGKAKKKTEEEDKAGGGEGGGVRGKKNRKKKKKTTQLKNFYSFQVKEDKMQHIKELRRKFEEDKLKIAKMKAERKFRPF